MSFSTRVGVRGRRGIAVFSALSMLIALMPVFFVALPAHATPGSDGNPNLVVTECGLDVLFVIDETGSMNDNSGQEEDLENAYKAFTTALAGTASRLGVIEFSSYPETYNTADPIPGAPDSARRVTNGYVSPGTIIDYPDGMGNALSTSSYQPGGYTNWQEALWDADNFATSYGAPDLLIFFTDGNPNTIDGAGFGVTSNNPAAAAAEPYADALKAKGVHMLGIGLGLADGSSSETRLSSVTGDEQGSSGSPDITTDDYILLTSSSQIANALEEVADQICPTTLKVTKHVPKAPGASIDNPGDWDTASGWDFAITAPVALSGIHGLSGTSDTTDSSGNVQFSWSNDMRGETSSTTLNETIQPGWGIVGAVCSSPDISGGAPFSLTYNNGWAISGIPDRATVDCDVYNQGSFLTLDKNVVNDDGGQADDSDFNLKATGPVTESGNDGFSARLVPGGDYVLSETGPGGYTAGSWSCGDAPLQGSTVTLAVGSHVLCEITNDDVQPTLTLEKIVDNSNGGSATAGQWTLTAARQGGGGLLQGSSGVSGPMMGGTYDLAESNGPTGYSQVGEWSCTNGGGADGQVSLISGQNVTCTVTNASQPAKLTLVKSVNNQYGTQEVAGSWNLAADGPAGNDFNGAGGATQDNLPAGDYVLSESGPDGWTESAWSCPGATLNDATVTLGIGDDVTCTITNSPIRPTLTLVKDLQLGQGANETEADFTLTADGPILIEVPGADVQSAVANDANVGTYDLSESGQAGYSQVGGWVCVGGTQNGDQITLEVDDDAVCTVTNASNPAQVTLTKVVNNNHGGDLGPADFQLTLNDSDVDQGVNAVVPNTEYSVSEDDVAGYSQVGSVVCVDDNTQGAVAHPFTLDEGQEITCTITNEDEPGAITVVKRFAHPTSVDPDDFDLTVTPDGGQAIDVLSGDMTEVDGNKTYTVGETLLEGWSQISLECEDGDDPVDHPVELANGQHVTCVITNGENPSITVEKVTDGEDTATFDFTGDAGDFSFDENGGSETFEVDPGLYEVTETPAEFWSLTDVSCSDGASGDLNSATGSFDVDFGDHQTCTFTNVQLPKTIEVVAEGVCEGPLAQLKWVINPVNFNGTEVDITWLDIDPLDPLYQHLAQPLQGTMDWPGIVVDNGEVVDWPGWLMVDGKWVQGADGYEGTIPTAEILFSVDPDLIVMVDYPDCSEPPAQIIVEKQVEGDSPQDFAFTFTTAGFTLGDDTLAHGESSSSGDLLSGDGYSVSEALPSGWEQVSAVCDDGSDPSNIELSAGEVVTCTFTNNLPDEVEPIEVLPFTGLDGDILLALAIVLAAAGGLALFFSRKKDGTESLDR